MSDVPVLLIEEVSVQIDNSLFLLKEEIKEEPGSYVTVTIDTKHKVKDHYNVHEKLGV